MHLTSIGLIEFNHSSGYGIKKPLTEIAPSYCRQVYRLKSDGGTERRFQIGHTIFTAVGRELAKIADAPGNDAFCKAALGKWNEEGWKEAEEEKPA